METENIPQRFIFIDDDEINNLICSIVVESAVSESEVRAFEVPEEALAYMKDCPVNKKPAFVFLDINMPSWSGWEFLDEFEKLAGGIKNQFKIYMLSSSVNPTDRERALENKYVLDYIEKPLRESYILSILSK